MAPRSARIVNAAQVEQALLAAFEEWVEEDVNDKYWREQFFSKKWKYNNVTIRKNGDTAGPGPRAIVDLQNLYKSGIESLKLEIGRDGAEARWHWDAKNSSGEEYAWYVHEGEGPHSVTPRKWTDELSDEWLFGYSAIKRDLMDAIERHLNAVRPNRIPFQ